MADIYSLTWKRDLCSISSIKQNQRTFLIGITDEVGASQYGRKHSFQDGRNAQFATCWVYNHVVLQFCY